VAEPSLTLRLPQHDAGSGARGEVADALAVRDILEPAVIEAAAAAGTIEPSSPSWGRDARVALGADTPEFYRRNLEFTGDRALCRNDVLRTIYEGLLNAVRAGNRASSLLPGQNWRALHASRVRVTRPSPMRSWRSVVAARVAAAATRRPDCRGVPRR